MSIRDWFLAPSPVTRHTSPDPGEEDPAEPASLARDAVTRTSPPGAAATWAPPAEPAPAYCSASRNGSTAHIAAPAVGSPTHADGPLASVAAPAGGSPTHADGPFASVAAPAGGSPAHADGPLASVAAPAGGSPAHIPAVWAPPVGAGRAHRGARVDAEPDNAAARSIASAAVIGRPGEAEPVAAAIALALRGPAPAAAVIVVGEPRAPNADGGTRAARRLAARLEAHGFEAAARGRLAWAYVTPDAARRAARVAGAPVALAITMPLNLALELATSDQDLAIVVARDEHGPLAQLATASLACHDVTTSTPLRRGVSRLLALHGLRAPGDVRTIVHA